ncbi:MAG TPA: hypothetical protein VGA47_09900 [Candidatus Dormibacteraeota bacterium]
MAALLRRGPVILYVVIAFAWTWTYVILFLIERTNSVSVGGRAKSPKLAGGTSPGPRK